MNVLDILKNKKLSVVINNDNNHLILLSEEANSYIDLGDIDDTEFIGFPEYKIIEDKSMALE